MRSIIVSALTLLATQTLGLNLEAKVDATAELAGRYEDYEDYNDFTLDTKA